MDVNTKMDEVFGDQVKNDQGWKNEIGNFMLTLPSAVINTQTEFLRDFRVFCAISEFFVRFLIL